VRARTYREAREAAAGHRPLRMRESVCHTVCVCVCVTVFCTLQRRGSAL
jgi:hypothetical protein